MIRQTLASFISVAGIGATILTILVLTAVQPQDFAVGDQLADGRTNRGVLGGELHIKEDRIPSCGEAYRKECESYYRMDHWNHDVIHYGDTTIKIWHKVSYDRTRQQYQYEYKIDYDGNKNVLMRWDVLDHMRSENPESSCILDLRNCHPHKFTMWCSDAPVMHGGKIQLYNNRPNTDDWNYWQCNQTSECSGPVPSSYARQRICFSECENLES